MNKYLIILAFIILASCQENLDNEMEVPIKQCLEEFEVVLTDPDCSESNLDPNRELVSMGHKSIAEELKYYFSDFCNPISSSINFENENGEISEVKIEGKSFETLAYRIISATKIWCLDGERAVTNFVSHNFSLELNFVTSLEAGITESNKEDKIYTSFSIFAREENSKQIIFDMDLANFYDEIIEPDTAIVRYHESIILNDKEYIGLYSNKAITNTNGLLRKEKIYFHPSDGLIGVRDSLGVLWTRP